MGAYVYGLIYTILFVLLGKLFIEALGCTYRSENREIRILLLIGMTIGMYAISILLNGNWIVKEILCMVGLCIYYVGIF